MQLYSQASDSETQPWAAFGLSTAPSYASDFATFVLDKLGQIRFCDAAALRMFGTARHKLLTRHIRALIPDLPITPETPGYNIAYATFWGSDAPGREFGGLDRHGRSFRLEITLSAITLDGDHRILLSVRRPAQLSGMRGELDRPNVFEPEQNGSAENPRPIRLLPRPAFAPAPCVL